MPTIYICGRQRWLKQLLFCSKLTRSWFEALVHTQGEPHKRLFTVSFISCSLWQLIHLVQPKTDKQKHILLSKGPFASTFFLAQMGFGGNSCPSSVIVNIMQNLAADGFGQDQTVKRSTVLFKKLPSSMTDEDLAKYNLFVLKYWLLPCSISFHFTISTVQR